MNAITRLEETSQPFRAAAVFVLVVGIGIFGALTGYELGFSLFYLFPVSLAAWFGGKRIGIATSVAAFSWLAADAITGHPYSHPANIYWNTIIRLCVFLIVAQLISALRKAHEA